ncbi:MAG: PAS domain S-box protein, partial [Bacteroidota bacterium]
PRLDSLLKYIDQRLLFSDSNVIVYQQKGSEAALARVGTGKLYFDKIKDFTNSIQRAENILLAQRKEISDKKAAEQNGFFFSLITTILLLLGIFIQKVRLDFKEKKRVTEELASLNRELEKKVEERTGDFLMANRKLEDTFLRISDAFVALDKDLKYTFLNEQAEKMIGYKATSVLGKYIWEVFPDAADSATAQGINKAMKEQRYIRNEDYYPPLNLWQENHIYPSPDGVSIFVRDISERKLAEKKILKANRLYFFISQVNQMIVRVKDEATLFDETCRIAVNMGRFRMAWIALIDEKTGKLVPVIHSAVGGDYLERIKQGIIDNVALGRGPSSKSIKEGTYVICNDIESDALMNHWKQEAKANGYLSSMHLPLRKFDKIVGSVAFYANEKNFFDESEIALLTEATGDVCFALENFERERIKQIAEEEIVKEKNLSDSIINALPGIFYMYDETGKFLRWNKNFERVSGYAADEIAHMHPLDFFDEDEKEMLKEKIGNVFVSGEDNVQANFLLKSKQKIPYYFTGVAVDYKNKKCLMGVGIDFSERVRAQEEIKDSSDKLHQLTAHLQNIREEERKRIGREIHDELGQQLTAIKMDVAWIDKNTATQQEAIKVKLKNVLDLINGSNNSVRRILSELRPAILDDYGLKEALDWLSTQFTGITGVPVDFIAKEEATGHKQVPEQVTMCIFRIYQEALTNITRYAAAEKVTTVLNLKDNKVEFHVEDNGKGFDISKVQAKKSFGILGMKERVLSLKGQFELVTEPEKGTKIDISIPIDFNKN